MASGADGAGGRRWAILGEVRPVEAPGKVLRLLRATFDPGARIGPHRHPGASVSHVEAGRLGLTVHAGAARVARAGGTGGEGEAPPPGVELILGPGDGFVLDRAVHSERNAGAEPLVIVLTVLLDADAPVTEMVEREGGVDVGLGRVAGPGVETPPRRSRPRANGQG